VHASTAILKRDGRDHSPSMKQSAVVPMTTTTLGMRSFVVAEWYGTVYQSLCEPQLSPLRRSLDIWRLTCLADRHRVWGLLFMTCSTNPLIIIIIIYRTVSYNLFCI